METMRWRNKDFQCSLGPSHVCAPSFALIHENIHVYHEVHKDSSSIYTGLELLLLRFPTSYPQGNEWVRSISRSISFKKKHEMVTNLHVHKIGKAKLCLRWG